MRRRVGREGAAVLRRLAGSRTEPAAVLQRARIIRALLEEPALAAGDATLRDAPRTGRPPTHTPEAQSRLIALAVLVRQCLDYPLSTLGAVARAPQGFVEPLRCTRGSAMRRHHPVHHSP